MSTILHFSDLHLSPDVPQTVRNWEFCLEVVATQRPDLTIITGDLILDDPDCDEHHAFALRQLQRLEGDWLVVPGNHDVGDSVEAPYQKQAITEERRDRYRQRFGADWWSRAVGHFRVIGLNAMLFGSALPAEDEQIEWLLEQVARQHGPVVVALHKPICVEFLDEPAQPALALTPEARRKLLVALQPLDIRLVVSGHLHCHRYIESQGFGMVWAPTTCIVHRTRVSGVTKSTGWLEITLTGDRMTWRHHTASALVPLDVTHALSMHQALRYVPWSAFLASAAASKAPSST